MERRAKWSLRVFVVGFASGVLYLLGWFVAWSVGAL